MKKVLLILAMVTASVLFAQPAVAEDATTTEAVAAESADTPAEAEAPPPPPPVESEPPSEPETPDPAPPVEDNTPPAEETEAEDVPADDAADTQAKAAGAPETAMVSADAVAAAPASKVWVCKYVGTPGEDEHLKPGKNPIEVNANAVPPNPVVGTFFNDAQGRSFVAQIGGEDPGLGSCFVAVQATEVTTEEPIVSPPTCAEDGALTLPNTPGVLYTVTPAYAGPGEYDVDATALDNYELSDESETHWDVTVLEQLSGQVDCPIIVDPDVKKVWVCKFVGKPGVDEVLKGGKNPIEVSVNALPGSPVNPQVGDEFNDAQERSVVVALSPADPEPTVEDCPQPIQPMEVVAEAPIADPATCEEDGSLVLPETEGVTYTVEPEFDGPGDYVITATVVNDDFELVGQTVFEVTVGGKIPSDECLLPGGGEDPDDGGLLPDTGGSSLELLLAAFAMMAAGSLLLMRRTPAAVESTPAWMSAHSLTLPTMAEMARTREAWDSLQPVRLMTVRESVVTTLRPLFRRRRN